MLLDVSNHQTHADVRFLFLSFVLIVTIAFVADLFCLDNLDDHVPEIELSKSIVGQEGFRMTRHFSFAHHTATHTRTTLS